MSEKTKVYDLDSVLVNFMGQTISEGYGTGGAIVIEPQEPGFTQVVGADGTIVRSKTGNKLYKVTITLLQTADANQVLSAIHNLDLSLPNGAGVGPLTVKDLQSTSLFFANRSWIAGPPAEPFNKEAGDRVWEIMAERTVHNVGNS